MKLSGGGRDAFTGRQGQMGQEGRRVDAQEREKIAGPPARDEAHRSEKIGGTCVGQSGRRPSNFEKPC